MMNSAVLDFRMLLSMIAIIFGTREFTSRELSDRLRAEIGHTATVNPHSTRLYLRSSRKLISNDLRRLYAMGFLKRKKVKRRCRTKSGKVCFRGYEYRYSISSQGWKYLGYLVRGGEEEENLEGLADVIVKIFLEKKVPEKDRDIFWEGFRRFSTSTMAFWDKVVERIAEIYRDKRIKSLESKVKMLEEENEELTKKIKELEMEKAVYTQNS